MCFIKPIPYNCRSQLTIKQSWGVQAGKKNPPQHPLSYNLLYWQLWASARETRYRSSLTFGADSRCPELQQFWRSPRWGEGESVWSSLQSLTKYSEVFWHSEHDCFYKFMCLYPFFLWGFCGRFFHCAEAERDSGEECCCWSCPKTRLFRFGLLTLPPSWPSVSKSGWQSLLLGREALVGVWWWAIATSWAGKLWWALGKFHRHFE